MKTCKQCGKPLDDWFSVCPYCETPQNEILIAKETPTFEEAARSSPFVSPSRAEPSAPAAPFPASALSDPLSPGVSAPAAPGRIKALVLGIIGTVAAVICVLFSFAFLACVLTRTPIDTVGLSIPMFGTEVVVLIVTILSAVDAILYRANKGLPCGKVRVGRILSIVAFAVAVAALIVYLFCRNGVFGEWIPFTEI